MTDFESLSDEVKALVTIQRHIVTVQKYLNRLSQELQRRALEHDLSKFSKGEFSGFVEVNRIAKEHPYPSPSLKDNKTIALHFSRNRHHPEYHTNGIADMSLLDIVEMAIDWKAASETYGNNDLKAVLAKQQERFTMSDRHMWLIELILKELD